MSPTRVAIECPHLGPGEEGVITAKICAPKMPGLYSTEWGFVQRYQLSFSDEDPRLTDHGELFGDRLWCQVIVPVNGERAESLHPVSVDQRIERDHISKSLAESRVLERRELLVEGDGGKPISESGERTLCDDCRISSLLRKKDDEGSSAKSQSYNSAEMLIMNTKPIISMMTEEEVLQYMSHVMRIAGPRIFLLSYNTDYLAICRCLNLGVEMKGKVLRTTLENLLDCGYLENCLTNDLPLHTVSQKYNDLFQLADNEEYCEAKIDELAKKYKGMTVPTMLENFSAEVFERFEDSDADAELANHSAVDTTRQLEEQNCEKDRHSDSEYSSEYDDEEEEEDGCSDGSIGDEEEEDEEIVRELEMAAKAECLQMVNEKEVKSDAEHIDHKVSEYFEKKRKEEEETCDNVAGNEVKDREYILPSKELCSTANEEIESISEIVQVEDREEIDDVEGEVEDTDGEGEVCEEAEVEDADEEGEVCQWREVDDTDEEGEVCQVEDADEEGEVCQVEDADEEGEICQGGEMEYADEEGEVCQEEVEYVNEEGEVCEEGGEVCQEGEVECVYEEGEVCQEGEVENANEEGEVCEEREVEYANEEDEVCEEGEVEYTDEEGEICGEGEVEYTDEEGEEVEDRDEEGEVCEEGKVEEDTDEEVCEEEKVEDTDEEDCEEREVEKYTNEEECEVEMPREVLEGEEKVDHAEGFHAESLPCEDFTSRMENEMAGQEMNAALDTSSSLLSEEEEEGVKEYFTELNVENTREIEGAVCATPIDNPQCLRSERETTFNKEPTGAAQSDKLIKKIFYDEVTSVPGPVYVVYERKTNSHEDSFGKVDENSHDGSFFKIEESSQEGSFCKVDEDDCEDEMSSSYSEYSEESDSSLDSEDDCLVIDDEREIRPLEDEAVIINGENEANSTRHSEEELKLNEAVSGTQGEIGTSLVDIKKDVTSLHKNFNQNVQVHLDFEQISCKPTTVGRNRGEHPGPSDALTFQERHFTVSSRPPPVAVQVPDSDDESFDGLVYINDTDIPSSVPPTEPCSPSNPPQPSLPSNNYPPPTALSEKSVSCSSFSEFDDEDEGDDEEEGEDGGEGEDAGEGVEEELAVAAAPAENDCTPTSPASQSFLSKSFSDMLNSFGF